MKNPAIKIKNLSYKYLASKNPALTDINLEISKGSFFTFIGPSGSGKSTLLTLIRGFYQEIGGKLQGQITVFNKDVNKTPISELGKTIGIVFQNPALQLHQLRVIDEVMSAPMYQGLPYKECQKRAIAILDKILEKKFYQSSPSELSAGQQQKVALAASLSLDADILLLDEPFSFLDETADQKLINFLVKLHKEGKTIVVATHDITQISKYSTHMGVMDKGKLVLKGNPKEILYSNKLSEIMPLPLFVEVSKRNKVTDKPLSWEEILPKISVKKITFSKGIKRNDKPKLLIKNISFKYPATKNGIHNINFNINKGEIFGIIGSNGSGKTTLAKIILGLLSPFSGKLQLDKIAITKLSTDKRAKKIGYVTQDPLDMFFENNLLDEVAAGPKFLNLPKAKQSAEETLKQFDLWQYKDKHPDSISGGEKSKLGIADILVNKTDVLLLDEPEFGLDPKSWEEIEKILIKLKTLGKTVIVITQDLEVAFFLCDRIAVMKEGEILKIDSPLKIFKDRNLLKNAKLPLLPFFPLLKDFNDNIKISRETFLKQINKNHE